MKQFKLDIYRINKQHKDVLFGTKFNNLEELLFDLFSSEVLENKDAKFS